MNRKTSESNGMAEHPHSFLLHYATRNLTANQLYQNCRRTSCLTSIQKDTKSSLLNLQTAILCLSSKQAHIRVFNSSISRKRPKESKLALAINCTKIRLSIKRLHHRKTQTAPISVMTYVCHTWSANCK